MKSMVFYYLSTIARNFFFPESYQFSCNFWFSFMSKMFIAYLSCLSRLFFTSRVAFSQLSTAWSFCGSIMHYDLHPFWKCKKGWISFKQSIDSNFSVEKIWRTARKTNLKKVLKSFYQQRFHPSFIINYLY